MLEIGIRDIKGHGNDGVDAELALAIKWLPVGYILCQQAFT